MSNIRRLTFAQFIATGTDTDDLRGVLADAFPDEHCPDPIPGRLYAGELNLYLEPSSQPDRGAFVVEIGNMAHFGTLEECEARLYGFYVSECADDEVAAYLYDTLPDPAKALIKPREQGDELAQMWVLYAAFQAFHGIELERAEVHLDDPGLTTEQRAWLKGFDDRWNLYVLGITPRAGASRPV